MSSKEDECCICGRDDNLQLHHSNGYVENSIEGVKVLCFDCHLKEEGKFRNWGVDLDVTG